jgi:hypothetical protein
MDAATAIEIARDWVRREGVAGHPEVQAATREIAQSLISVLPQTDDWAIIDTKLVPGVAEERQYVVVVDDGGLYRAFSEVQDGSTRVVGCERIPLDENVRMHVTDLERPEAGGHRFYRNLTLTFAGDPPALSFMLDWIREAEDREPSREERFAQALAAALGWELGPVPPDLTP